MHGDCLTVTGKTVAENLADIAPPDPDGKVLRALDKPIHATGGITILRGSLAPDGAVVKSAGFDSDVFEGTARVFDGERAALDALEDGKYPVLILTDTNLLIRTSIPGYVLSYITLCLSYSLGRYPRVYPFLNSLRSSRYILTTL